MSVNAMPIKLFKPGPSALRERKPTPTEKCSLSINGSTAEGQFAVRRLTAISFCWALVSLFNGRTVLLFLLIFASTTGLLSQTFLLALEILSRANWLN